ncbi:MAG: hypothetical protein M5U28_39735 [Sandaracinaceae bacterium]|nr:hypothetical protein [Sandaracinaceae bacterium]
MLRYDGASWRFARTDLRRFGSSRCPQLSAIVNAGGALVVATSDDRVVIDRPPAP